MAEFTKQNPKQEVTKELKKELTYEDKVLQKIIGISLEDVDGLLTVDGGFFSNLAEKFVNTDTTTAGVNVEVGKKQVAVDLDIVVEYGRNIPELFDKIIKTVQKNVNEMTGLSLIEANVKVVDIKSKEQYEQDSVTVQDRVSDFSEKAGNTIGEQTEKVKSVASKTTENVKEKVDNSRVQ